jgi:hypothetical protein
VLFQDEAKPRPRCRHRKRLRLIETTQFDQGEQHLWEHSMFDNRRRNAGDTHERSLSTIEETRRTCVGLGSSMVFFRLRRSVACNEASTRSSLENDKAPIIKVLHPSSSPTKTHHSPNHNTTYTKRTPFLSKRRLLVCASCHLRTFGSLSAFSHR